MSAPAAGAPRRGLKPLVGYAAPVGGECAAPVGGAPGVAPPAVVVYAACAAGAPGASTLPAMLSRHSASMATVAALGLRLGTTRNRRQSRRFGIRMRAAVEEAGTLEEQATMLQALLLNGTTRDRPTSISLLTTMDEVDTAEEAEEATVLEEMDQAEQRSPSLFDDGASATITTPLFYANGPPHIGSAYPTIACDALARYFRLRGVEVHFITGVDEHGEKIAQTAAGLGQQPKELVDDLVGEFQTLWHRLNIEPDHFARTTSPAHRAIVNEVWHRCVEKGDIYKKDYEGWYCIGCEAYMQSEDMQEGHVCKIHQTECTLRREENYFFRLSKYWDQLQTLMNENPDFISPRGSMTQVRLWLSGDKRDFSISRGNTSWGIPVPGDSSQVIYVWFDALIGYVSGLLQPGDPATIEAAVQRGWPADMHVIGKDIVRFHALYWPAILMSAGLPLPKHIATHGFLTKDGLKMGKTLGNVVEPLPLVEAFGPDAVRFFFASCLRFGNDGDFCYKAFIRDVNDSLANKLGNMVQRVLSLCRKNLPEPVSALELFDSEEEASSHPVYQVGTVAHERVAQLYEELQLHLVAEEALKIIETGDLTINEVEPWKKLRKKSSEEDRRLALRELLIQAEGVRVCALLLAPIIPDLSGRILETLGASPGEGGQLSWEDARWRWDALPGLAQGPKPQPVFQRIDAEPWLDL